MSPNQSKQWNKKLIPETLRWVGDINGHLELIDQRKLPAELTYIKCSTTEEVFLAIKDLAVRGAPAIGVTAAYGAFISERSAYGIVRGCEILAESRPTAVNLFWALEKMKKTASELKKQNPGKEVFLENLLQAAKNIHEEDIQMCRSIGQHGGDFIKDNFGVLTHCNAGSLATSSFGTALAVIYHAHLQGKKFTVFADETRPILQGARLTHWELSQAGVDVVLICDDMAGYAMQQGKVDIVIVGADRIASNGDTANKIGTYSLAVLAQKHNIPFYVAAPVSTFDFNIANGQQIPIEERNHDEVRKFGNTHASKPDAKVWNPAFDVTPAELITAIITDKGIIENPNAENVREMTNV